MNVEPKAPGFEAPPLIDYTSSLSSNLLQHGNMVSTQISKWPDIAIEGERNEIQGRDVYEVPFHIRQDKKTILSGVIPIQNLVGFGDSC